MSSIDDGPSDFETLIRPVIDRRLFLKGGSAALGLFLAGSPLIKLLASDAEPGRSSLLNFTPVPASTADTFVVPSGYHARPLISWETRSYRERQPSMKVAAGLLPIRLSRWAITTMA